MEGFQVKIVLIDLSGIFRRHWHATEDQEVGEALKRTLSDVSAVVGEYDAVGICVDRPPYHRTKIDPSYKQNRAKASGMMHDQQRRCIAQLSEDGLHILGADGFEADDCIATACEWAVRAGHHVTILSADKDILSLVRDGVVVVSTATGQRFGHAEVLAKFGVPPDLMPDLLALMGDKSDNIKGIPGCGPKTAAGWLAEHGDLAGVINNADKLGRFRELVEAARDSLGISWRLTQLATDVPINPEEIMQRKEPVKTEVQEPVAEEPAAAPEVIEEQPRPKPQQAVARIMPAQPPAAPQEWARSLEPRDQTQAWGLANMLFKSRMFGDFPNPESILAIVMTGRSHGLDAVTSLRGFHCIKGKASPSAQMMIGLVKRHPTCEYFRMVHSDGESATWETKRRDEPEPTTMTFTIEDARIAGLLGNDNWKKRPGVMCIWRCGVQLARIVYPDVVTGLYTPEELREVEQAA